MGDRLLAGVLPAAPDGPASIIDVSQVALWSFGRLEVVTDKGELKLLQNTPSASILHAGAGQRNPDLAFQRLESVVPPDHRHFVRRREKRANCKNITTTSSFEASMKSLPTTLHLDCRL